MNGIGGIAPARRRFKPAYPRTIPDVLAARDAYNESARLHQWFVNVSFTEDVADRLHKRLLAIGEGDTVRGLDAFKRALSTIPENDWLMGRLPPTNGRNRPFKLDLDYLLQTKGKSGDVLIKLIDRSGEVGSQPDCHIEDVDKLARKPATRKFVTAPQWCRLINGQPWRPEYGAPPDDPRCELSSEVIQAITAMRPNS